MLNFRKLHLDPGNAIACLQQPGLVPGSFMSFRVPLAACACCMRLREGRLIYLEPAKALADQHAEEFRLAQALAARCMDLCLADPVQAAHVTLAEVMSVI